jgi:hypothetical protein
VPWALVKALEEAISFAGQGDCLVVTKICCLARSVSAASSSGNATPLCVVPLAYSLSAIGQVAPGRHSVI